MQRWFEPLSPELISQTDWKALLVWLGSVCSALKGERPWFVEAHQFRIDTSDGIGRPTPEGAHRDGVDFVAVLLVGTVGSLLNALAIHHKTGVPSPAVATTVFQIQVRRQVIPGCTPGIQIVQTAPRKFCKALRTQGRVALLRE